MNNLGLVVSNGNEWAWTSKDISEWANKEHKNVMANIRDEMEKLGEVGRLIFQPSSYINSQNKEQPCYKLTEDGVHQIATRYDAVTRYKLIQKVKELSKPQMPTTFIEALTQLLESEKAKQLAIEQRNEAIRTKAMISDKKTATALGKVGGLAKANNKYRKEVGFAKEYATIKKVLIATKKNYEWLPLRKYSRANNLDIIKVSDINYEEVNAYHALAWRNVYGIDLEKLVESDNAK